MPPAQKTSSWIWVIVLGLAPFVISVAAYGYVTVVDANNQKRHIYQMDLSKSADLPAADTKFVELSSTLQQDYEYVLDEKSAMDTRHSYTPLTETNWRPGQPVKYFLYIESHDQSRVIVGHINKQTGGYEMPPSHGPYASTFDGQIAQGTLPTYVKSGLERRGIQIAEPYYVLDWMGDFNGQVGSRYESQMYYLIPVVGGIFSLIFLFVWWIDAIYPQESLENS